MTDPSANVLPNFEGLLGDAGATPSQDPGQGGTTPVPQPTQVQPQQQTPEVQFSEYAQSLLGEVDEADRASVEKYISKWDAGVERRVRELEATYGPIDQLLTNNNYSPEDLQTAAELYYLLNTQPEKAIKALNDAYGKQGDQASQQPNNGQPQQTTQLPPEIDKKLTDMQQMMEQVALAEQNRQAQASQADQDKSLEDYLGFLRREKGEFDETFVLTQMAAGVPGDKAVDVFNQMIQQYRQPVSNRLPAPPVLNGGSAVGGGSKPIHEYTPAERRAFVAQVLTQANQQGN